MGHLKICRVWIRSGLQKKASCRVQAIRSSLAHGRRLEPNVATLQQTCGNPSSCNAVKLSLPLTLLTACQTANRKNDNSVQRTNSKQQELRGHWRRSPKEFGCDLKLATNTLQTQSLFITLMYPHHAGHWGNSDIQLTS